MSNTTPFPYRRYLSPATAHLEPVIEWYESALGDQDHATEVEGHAYYAGLVDALGGALVLALSVPDEHVTAYVEGGDPPEPDPPPPVRSTILAVIDHAGEWVYVDDRVTVVDMPYVRMERDPETIRNYLQIFREYGDMDEYVQELEALLEATEEGEPGPMTKAKAREVIRALSREGITLTTLPASALADLALAALDDDDPVFTEGRERDE
jgi:hypothetical protein